MATVNSFGTGWGPFSNAVAGPRLLHGRDVRMREDQVIGAVGIDSGGKLYIDDRSLPAAARKQRVQLSRGKGCVADGTANGHGPGQQQDAAKCICGSGPGEENNVGSGNLHHGVLAEASACQAGRSGQVSWKEGPIIQGRRPAPPAGMARQARHACPRLSASGVGGAGFRHCQSMLDWGDEHSPRVKGRLRRPLQSDPGRS